MSSLRRAANGNAIRLNDPNYALDVACQNERANWVASRIGLPTTGSRLVNEHGIEWVVQNHATVPHYESLQRWRMGDVWPEQDMYPVIVPTNFSPKLMEFYHAIDRCTTKTFALLDTMPGRRKDGHVPGGNSIDTLCHPETNLLFLDAARVHETVIAHEFGHAWVQYVDECEDLRTIKDASDPQRMRHVAFVQSFVLDLKVNDLLRRKGFDMSPIEEDQAKSMQQLAEALSRGYDPSLPRAEVFMSLLVADQMIRRDQGQSHNLARFDRSLEIISDRRPSLARLADRLAESVRKRGYDSHADVLATIDKCLVATFEHCEDRIDLDRELVLVNPEEPDNDKFPEWLAPLHPRTKCAAGKHMARNDISSDWTQHLEPSITGRAKVCFGSPERDRFSNVVLQERLGPPNRYSDLPELMAELLALKHLNQTGRYQFGGGPPFQSSDLHKRTDLPEPLKSGASIPQFTGPTPAPNFHSRPPILPGRPYMAGYGRFLTQTALEMQLAGEHPYGYAFNNPVTYVDPSGEAPCGSGEAPCGGSDCSTYPGGPCAYAKSVGADNGAGGGVVCCNGKKYTCAWNIPKGEPPGITKCILAHERTHLGQMTCPPTGFSRPGFNPGENLNKDECAAYVAEYQCLLNTRGVDCNNITGTARTDCLNNYHSRLCQICDVMKNQYHCSPPQIPSFCKNCP